MNFESAIFDLDGTLLDSMPIWDTIGEDYLIKRGMAPEKGLNKRFKTMSIIQAAHYYQRVYGITDSIADIVNGIDSMVEDFYSTTVKIKPGVNELLNEFTKLGIKMCIATATDRYMVEAALSHCNIRKYFTDVLTCSEVGYGKDMPVIYERAVSILNSRKSETLIFEDALHAIHTAKNAGFRVAAIYDKASDEDQAAIKKLADIYLPSYDNWKELIL